MKKRFLPSLTAAIMSAAVFSPASAQDSGTLNVYGNTVQAVIAAILAATLSFPTQVQAQTPAASTNGSTKITAGLTYQQLLPILAAPPALRRSITIQNNQTSGTDVCYIIFGSNLAITAGTTTTSSSFTINGISVTAAQASIALAPQASWTRYFPEIPSDAIYGTCTTTGDSIYVDTQ
jgi:hypothetical protein